MTAIGGLPADDEARVWADQAAIWTDDDGYAWLDPTVTVQAEADVDAPMAVEHRGDGWWAWPVSETGGVSGVRCRGLGEVGVPGVPVDE